jgi:hypothetical protein
MVLEQLIDRSWMLKGRVALYVTVRPQLIGPGRPVVLVPFRVIAGKEAIIERKTVVNEEGKVGIGFDVVVMDLVIRQEVVNDSAEESDVATGTKGCVEIGYSGRARKTGVDGDEHPHTTDNLVGQVARLVAEAARKPVESQRLTVAPSPFLETKFASRSAFISRVSRSMASFQEMRFHSVLLYSRTSG